jgi:hypothetical protein
MSAFSTCTPSKLSVASKIAQRWTDADILSMALEASAKKRGKSINDPFEVAIYSCFVFFS